MKKQIEIAGVTLEVVFSFYTYRLLGDLWGKKSVNEVMQYITSATSGVDEGDVTFESMKVYSDIISVFDNDKKLSEAEIQNHLFQQPGLIAMVIEAFINSLTVTEAKEVKKK